MSRAAASSAKALQAILPLVESGQPYEAHQKARTFASRYQKSNQFDTAIDVLFQSARELLKAGQQGSGTDLALFLLDVYDHKPEKVTEESRGRITQLIALVGSEQTWRKSIIDKAVAWSVKHGAHPAGDPTLHHYIGEVLYKDGAVEAAEVHFLNSGSRDSARLLAQLYIDWAKQTDTLAEAAEPFALRGTLPYLLNGNILAARTFISTFVNLLPLDRAPFASTAQSTPITFQTKGASSGEDDVVITGLSALNFAQLAVRVCQRAEGDRNKTLREIWVRLCGTYQSRGGLVATKEVRAVLNELATVYFNIPPPRQQNANPMADMLAGMFGGAPGGSAPQRRAITPNNGMGLD
ncbi:hypothetical protein PENSPDRAFT_287400 [Peniophora sp. CONT]|nr:hypothetical protein PENSPDRAFT_287400 [Peniophora sp. CONT]